jgi:hypothetical protein
MYCTTVTRCSTQSCHSRVKISPAKEQKKKEAGAADTREGNTFQKWVALNLRRKTKVALGNKGRD